MQNSPFDIAYQNRNVESKIVAGLEKISQAFRVLLWNEGKDLSLSPIQMQILIFLLHHQEAYRTVSYLAVEFNMTKATISDAVRVLNEKSLVAKEVSARDTRSFTINLTRKGVAIAERISSFSKALQIPVAKLGDEEKEMLLSSLLSIIRHLNQSGIVTTQRMCFTCSFYKPGHEGHPHFCGLLNAPLESSALRIDCPDHQAPPDAQ